MRIFTCRGGIFSGSRRCCAATPTTSNDSARVKMYRKTTRIHDTTTGNSIRIRESFMVRVLPTIPFFVQK